MSATSFMSKESKKYPELAKILMIRKHLIIALILAGVGVCLNGIVIIVFKSKNPVLVLSNIIYMLLIWRNTKFVQQINRDVAYLKGYIDKLR